MRLGFRTDFATIDESILERPSRSAPKRVSLVSDDSLGTLASESVIEHRCACLSRDLEAVARKGSIATVVATSNGDELTGNGSRL